MGNSSGVFAPGERVRYAWQSDRFRDQPPIDGVVERGGAHLVYVRFDGEPDAVPVPADQLTRVSSLEASAMTEQTADLMTADDPFSAACMFAAAHGGENIRALPGCWERQVDDRWFIAINGHDTPTPTDGGKDGSGTPKKITPFSVYVEYNGWPAGELNYGGGWIAAGEGANAETFVAALRAALPPEPLLPTYAEDAGQ